MAKLISKRRLEIPEGCLTYSELVDSGLKRSYISNRLVLHPEIEAHYVKGQRYFYPEEIEKILEKRKKGPHPQTPENTYLMNQVAEMIGITYQSVQSRVKKLNIPEHYIKHKTKNVRYYTAEEVELIRKYEVPKKERVVTRRPHPDEVWMTFGQACKEVMAGYTTLDKYCKRLNVEVRKDENGFRYIKREDIPRLQEYSPPTGRPKGSTAKPKRDPILWKLSVRDEWGRLIIKAWCLTEQEAIDIQSTLWAIGIDARASPMVKSTYNDGKRYDWF